MPTVKFSFHLKPMEQPRYAIGMLVFLKRFFSNENIKSNSKLLQMKITWKTQNIYRLLALRCILSATYFFQRSYNSLSLSFLFFLSLSLLSILIFAWDSVLTFETTDTATSLVLSMRCSFLFNAISFMRVRCKYFYTIRLALMHHRSFGWYGSNVPSLASLIIHIQFFFSYCSLSFSLSSLTSISQKIWLNAFLWWLHTNCAVGMFVVYTQGKCLECDRRKGSHFQRLDFFFYFWIFSLLYSGSSGFDYDL